MTGERMEEYALEILNETNGGCENLGYLVTKIREILIEQEATLLFGLNRLREARNDCVSCCYYDNGVCSEENNDNYNGCVVKSAIKTVDDFSAIRRYGV